ncbi:MAG: hypothetical protein ABR548_02965 [Actinomycetota bacterium]|nr:hypothetical protein [Actinomycetota bacterium]
MTRALVSLAAGLVAYLTTQWLLRTTIPTATLRRKNYRGLLIATGMGVAVVAGIFAGAALTGLLFTVRQASRPLQIAAGNAAPLLALAGGFGLLGLFDDVWDVPGRGFRGHLSALRAGRATGGGLKLLAGSALAIAIGTSESTTMGWALVHGAIIALTANLFNGLDLRPGRAGKAFLIAALPLVVLVSAASATLAAGLGAVCAFLPHDLSERAMLGDAGANALGALVGGSIVFADPAPWFRYGLLAVLLVLTAFSERPGYGAVIDKFLPLRVLDRAGRVPEMTL